MNFCLFQGNLTRDPELKSIGSGTSVVNFGLAINDSRTSEDGKKRDTVFLEMEAWGKGAEAIAKFFKKGSGIIVECNVKPNDYTDAEGNMRRNLRFRVNKFFFPLRANTKAQDEEAPSEENVSVPTNGDDQDIPF